MQQYYNKTSNTKYKCRRIDREQICSTINQQLIAGRFGHAAAYKTVCKVLYAADEGLRGRNVLQLVVD